MSYPEILTGEPNWESREDETYKLSKKKVSHSQGCQPDLNLVPESWRLPHQIQELPGTVGCYHHKPGAGLTS